MWLFQHIQTNSVTSVGFLGDCDSLLYIVEVYMLAMQFQWSITAVLSCVVLLWWLTGWLIICYIYIWRILLTYSYAASQVYSPLSCCYDECRTAGLVDNMQNLNIWIPSKVMTQEESAYKFVYSIILIYWYFHCVTDQSILNEVCWTCAV